MQYFIVLLASWFLIGGIVSLFRQLPKLRNVVIINGKIIDWIKNTSYFGFPSYTPIVEFLDKEKNSLVKIPLNKDLISGFFFRRQVKIWIIINRQGAARALVGSLMEFLLPIGMIILGVVLLFQLASI